MEAHLLFEPLILYSQLHRFGLRPCQLILQLGILLIPLLQNLSHLSVQLGLPARLLLHQLEGLQAASARESFFSHHQGQCIRCELPSSSMRCCSTGLTSGQAVWRWVAVDFVLP